MADSTGDFPIRVVNSTHTFNFGRTLTRPEFLLIAKNGVNSVYNPKKFHAIFLRVRCEDEHSTVTSLIFTSGKVILTGAKSPKGALFAGAKICAQVNAIFSKWFMKRRRDPIKVCDMKLRNVVASGTFPFRLAIERFYLQWRGNRQKYGSIITTLRFDPTIFTGLRVVTPQFTTIIFISGKFIVTGLKSFEKIPQKFQMVHDLISFYKRSKFFPIK
jgi:TATA-box binding protein (TBP) (component of TFIID and TFIIIB)